jgi:GNAT superfamily N-acetyltransferase
MRDTDLQVRALRAADQPAWLPLWKGYQRFYEIAIPEPVTALTWQRFLDPAEPMFALGAFEKDALLGIVHYIFHRSCWLAGPTCYLQDLFTDPDHRGRGVGRRLIEAVYDQAREAGAGRVYWLTHQGNTTARKLYDQVAEDAGFIQYRKNLV